MTFARDQIAHWPLNVRDASVAELDQVPHGGIRSTNVIRAYPGHVRWNCLVVYHDERETLLVEPGQLLSDRAGEDGKQAGCELGGQDMLDEPAAVHVAHRVVDGVEHQLKGRLSDSFGYSTHDIGQHRPRKGRSQYAHEPAPPTCQIGGDDAGHKALLFHNA